jgi:hypothetical protein
MTYANYLRLDGEQLANELFPLRRPLGPRRYLRRRWRALLTVCGALGVALALILATLAASHEPFVDGFTGRVGALLERAAPGIVLGPAPQHTPKIDILRHAPTDRQVPLVARIQPRRAILQSSGPVTSEVHAN